MQSTGPKPSPSLADALAATPVRHDTHPARRTGSERPSVPLSFLLRPKRPEWYVAVRRLPTPLFLLDCGEADVLSKG